jgi:hypothetical protein
VDLSHWRIVPKIGHFLLRLRGCGLRIFARRDYPITAHTPQPLNLNFKDLNATTSKNLYDISSISSILYNLGSFQNFLKTLKNRENFGGVGVGG